MKKFTFLLALALVAGCNSDDDSTFLPDPVDDVPAPGELPITVSVVQNNLKDEICPEVGPLDRNGVLTHSWTAITDYTYSKDEITVQGDLLTAWDNNTVVDGINLICHSELVFPNATETYELSPITSDVIITTDPNYFQPEFAVE